MLKVTVEHWSSGEESSARTVAELHIFNDLSGTLEHGNYGVGGYETPSVHSRGFVRAATVRNHKRGRPALALVQAAVAVILAEEAKRDD